MQALRPRRRVADRQVGTAHAIDSERRTHEAAPDLRRDRPAADLAERLIVVAADPHADHQVAGKADEQSVAVRLGRPGLAEGRDGKRGTTAGAIVGGGIEQVEQRCLVAPAVKKAAGAEEGIEAGVGRLVLSHFYPVTDRYNVREQAGEAFGGKIEIGRDLMTIKL